MVQLAKFVRIGTMARAILEEVRNVELDENGRLKVREVYENSVRELKSGLEPELGTELDRLTEPFRREGTPSTPDLRLAQAQLVGWLEGVLQMVALTQQAMLAQVAQAQQLQHAQQTRGGRPAVPGAPAPPPALPREGEGRKAGPYM